MAKKNLAEAAAEILGANIAAKMKMGEPFGAGKTASGVVAPGQSGQYGAGQQVGGPNASADESGVRAGVEKAPRATPPGATPPVGAEPMKDIKKGEPGKDRAKADDSGVVEEEGDERSAHPGFEAGGRPHAQVEEEEEEEGYGKKHMKEEEEEEEGYGKKSKKHMREEEEEEEEGHKKHMREEEEEEEGKKKRMEEDAMADPMFHTPDDAGQKVKAYVKSKGAGAGIEEDIKAIFAGESLSESFMKKARKIYEAAVIASATKVVEDIQEEYANILKAHAEQVKNQLAEQVDDYLNYMVEEWVNENEIAIEQGLKSELTEDFISGLRNLFAEHYIDIPQDKVNVVEELAGKVENLESKLNEEINRNVSLRKALTEAKKEIIVNTVCESLTETQAAKIRSLAENIEYKTEEDFVDSVETLVENYFPSKAPKAASLNEDYASGEKTGFEEEKPVTAEMDQYVKAIRKTIK